MVLVGFEHMTTLDLLRTIAFDRSTTLAWPSGESQYSQHIQDAKGSMGSIPAYITL